MREMKNRADQKNQNNTAKNLLMDVGKDILKDLKTEASLDEIFEAVEKNSDLEAIRSNLNWRADLRFTFLQHCSDSRYYNGGEDLFYRIKTPVEVWGIRTRPKNTVRKDVDLIDDLFTKDKLFQKLNTTLQKNKNLLIPFDKKFNISELIDDYFHFIKDNIGDCSYKKLSLKNFFPDLDQATNEDLTLLKNSYYPFSQNASKNHNIPYYYIIDDVDIKLFKKIILDLLIIFRQNSQPTKDQDDLFADNLYTILLIEENSRTDTFIKQIFKNRFNEYHGLDILMDENP
jgi:hypothetical protein